MNFIKVFSNGLYNSKEAYSYFSEDEILNLPFDLYNLINIDQNTENKYIFSNIILFLTDLYVTLNIKDKDFKYIDSKLRKLLEWSLLTLLSFLQLSRQPCLTLRVGKSINADSTGNGRRIS